MLLDRLVDVVGHSGPVGGREGLATAVNQGTVESADDALKDRLDVAAVAPQAGRRVPGRHVQQVQHD